MGKRGKVAEDTSHLEALCVEFCCSEQGYEIYLTNLYLDKNEAFQI